MKKKPKKNKNYTDYNKSYNKSYNNYIFLIAIILLGFIVRLFTYSQVFEPGRIVFLETDPYYHMWRVFSYISTFPGTFLFEPYINYPYGSLVGWPPLFDQTIAFISIVLGSGKPGMHLVESVGAFMPVMLGVFSIISVYYITKEIFNEKIALYSSFLLAVLPAHAQISFLGFTDHHIAEVLLSVLSYMFFIKSLKGCSRKFAVISGIAIGVSFLTWLGAPIFIGILLSYAVIQFILDKKYAAQSGYLVETGVISFLTAFLVILLFYIWTPWQHIITAGTLSYFQLIYVAFSAAIIFFLGLLSKLMKNQKWYYYPLLIVLLSVFIFLFFIIGFPSFYESLSGGIGYLLRDSPALKQISEAQPLFYTFNGIFLGWQVFDNPVWYSFTFSFYIAIIGFVLLIWILYSRQPDAGKLFFVIWTVIVLFLALQQRRFTYTLSVNVAILSGFFIDKSIDKVSSLSLKSFKNVAVKNAAVAGIFIVFSLVLVIPNIEGSYGLSQSPPKPSDDWYDSLVWLKENTPQYGVMTWWDYGNWILYISKHPVVANNFQIGGDDAARFFLSPDETAANAIMDMRKARYVVVDRRMGLNKFIQGNQLVIRGAFTAVTSFADKDIAMYLDKSNLPNENYFQTMYAKMHVFDGNGLKNYRMIYESNETQYDLFDKPTSNIKIFEYVKGAKIAGNATSKIVSLSGKIITNQKRIYDYTQRTTANEHGYFEFTVPYSSDAPYGTRLLQGYELKYDNSSISINISENDVLNGNTRMVN